MPWQEVSTVSGPNQEESRPGPMSTVRPQQPEVQRLRRLGKSTV